MKVEERRVPGVKGSRMQVKDKRITEITCKQTHDPKIPKRPSRRRRPRPGKN